MCVRVLWTGVTMNAFDLQFASNSFDLAVDKGTLDALRCSHSAAELSGLFAQTQRVLKPNCSVIVITNAKDDEMDALTSPLHWTRTVRPCGGGKYHMYTLTKRPDGHS
jgi:hypothetical protein